VYSFNTMVVLAADPSASRSEHGVGSSTDVGGTSASPRGLQRSTLAETRRLAREAQPLPPALRSPRFGMGSQRLEDGTFWARQAMPEQSRPDVNLMLQHVPSRRRTKLVAGGSVNVGDTTPRLSARLRPHALGFTTPRLGDDEIARIMAAYMHHARSPKFDHRSEASQPYDVGSVASSGVQGAEDLAGNAPAFATSTDNAAHANETGEASTHAVVAGVEKSTPRKQATAVVTPFAAAQVRIRKLEDLGSHRQRREALAHKLTLMRG